MKVKVNDIIKFLPYHVPAHPTNGDFGIVLQINPKNKMILVEFEWNEQKHKIWVYSKDVEVFK